MTYSTRNQILLKKKQWSQELNSLVNTLLVILICQIEYSHTIIIGPASELGNFPRLSIVIIRMLRSVFLQLIFARKSVSVKCRQN